MSSPEISDRLVDMSTNVHQASEQVSAIRGVLLTLAAGGYWATFLDLLLMMRG